MKSANKNTSSKKQDKNITQDEEKWICGCNLNYKGYKNLKSYQ